MKQGLKYSIRAMLGLAFAFQTANLAAQGLGLGGAGGKPIEVLANQGIEWYQNEKKYVARGKASAKQGTTTVHGDTLIAYYQETKDEGSKIYRIDAVGNVKIVSPNETAYGDKGVYDVNNGVLVLTGRNLKLVTKEEIITARDSLEYYEKKDMAVARGNAKMDMKKTAKSEARSIRADILTANFKPRTEKPKEPQKNTGRPKGKTQAGKKSGRQQTRMKRMDAYGNVVVTRPGEVALGERGMYYPDRDIAELRGKVRITRGKNQLNGERAIVNFKTGISRLLAGKGGKSSPPVRALIERGQKKSATKPKKQTKPSKSGP